MSIKDFYTTEKASEGRKVKLKNPDGSVSDDWMMIRSQWCDEFQDKKSEILSSAVSLRELPELERADKFKEAQINMLVPLVSGWSFEEELNDENVKDLLINAPQIRETINSLASDDTFFFSDD